MVMFLLQVRPKQEVQLKVKAFLVCNIVLIDLYDYI